MKKSRSPKPGAAKRKIGIRRKIALFICLAIFTVMFVGIGLGYFLGYRLLRNTVAEDGVALAQNLATSVSGSLGITIDNIAMFATNPAHRDAISENTLKYKGKDAGAVNKYLLDMDEEWAESEADSPLVIGYLQGKSGERLKQYTLGNEAIAEIFTTDRFGGLVAASNKTSDFYQADEKWWQETYNDGKGNIFIGDIEYDESADAIAMTVALPVRDKEGNVIGVCKAILRADVLFGPIGDFKIGKTGHAVLVDNKGFIIWHPGIKPLSERLCDDKEFESLVNGPEKWAILTAPHIHKEVMFFSYAVVENPTLLESGIIWRVFIDQDAHEVFLPIKMLFIQMGIITGILVLIVVPVAFLFSGIFIRPIRTLHEATEHIGKGELDYPIEIRTGDEIEQLAGSFKSMVSNIKARRMELEALSNSLEERVRERTLDLERSQEATLHILEDLQTAKEALEEKTKGLAVAVEKAEKSREVMVSMLDDNNRVRKDLEKSLGELKKTQKMIVQAEKLSSLGKLVSEMAHEVNNPLQAISGRAQLALMGDIKDQELVEDLKIIEGQCYRARDIIKRLLDFSRPTKGEIVKTDMKEVVENTLKLVERQYSLRNVSIARDYSPEELRVEVDRNQMEEVFFNIVKNASEAMESGGNITVSTSRQGDKAQVAFKDTGPGMPAEVMEKVFDPFYTTKKDGTGLGLSVCYGLVKDHGGELRYESKPGEGTTAIVALPLK